jgi:cell fate regulator YaaT (PSP1 superfamily)
VPITPLPVYEADADPRYRTARTDEEIYRSLEAPKSLVVKFGAMKLVAEYPYDGQAKPGCGTKLVARTHRGTEVVEMLTTTCENAGCSKSITRQEMLEYIENSGGKDFPFHTEGRILRVATIDDLNRMSALTSSEREWVKLVKEAVAERGLPMKVVEVEPILGEEVLTIYFMSEERIDFRELVRQLASQFKTRIEMRQVGARDEARLVADYERCGQHCCCKNFLKVLKPISMRSAKVQKATLDPLKISGRCGRLMCCLRYEDQTYKDLKARLPHMKQRVGTSEGPGIVMDTKILAQLVLVQLEHNGEEIAVPVEELMDPEKCPPPRSPGEQSRRSPAAGDPLRGLSAEEVTERVGAGDRRPGARQDQFRSRDSDSNAPADPTAQANEVESAETESPGRRSQERRRSRRDRGRRRRPRRGGGPPRPNGGPDNPPS